MILSDGQGVDLLRLRRKYLDAVRATEAITNRGLATPLERRAIRVARRVRQQQQRAVEREIVAFVLSLEE